MYSNNSKNVELMQIAKYFISNKIITKINNDNFTYTILNFDVTKEFWQRFED